jgi:transcriptional regulator with XRE-family HTH domain
MLLPMSTDGRPRSPGARPQPPPQHPGGEYLERLIRRSGLGKRELGRRIDRSDSYISTLERGYKLRGDDYQYLDPSSHVLNQLATATGASPSERRELLRKWGKPPGPETAAAAEEARQQDLGEPLTVDEAVQLLASAPESEFLGIMTRLLQIRARVHGADDVEPGRSPGVDPDPEVDDVRS